MTDDTFSTPRVAIIKDYDPKNPEHRAIVAEWEADVELLQEFDARTRECFEINTGGSALDEYLHLAMNL